MQGDKICSDASVFAAELRELRARRRSQVIAGREGRGRRVALTRADLRRVRGWLGRRIGLGRPEPEAVPGLAELRAAKARSDRRTERAERPPAPESVPDARPATAAAATAPKSAPPPASRPRPTPARRADPAPAVEPPPDPGETLAERLARRRRGG